MHNFGLFGLMIQVCHDLFIRYPGIMPSRLPFEAVFFGFPELNCFEQPPTPSYPQS